MGGTIRVETEWTTTNTTNPVPPTKYNSGMGY